MSDTIASNITGLSFAEEATLKTLPGTPIWYSMEPNSFSDFGGQLKTVTRNTINPSRQLQKGVTTDLDANGGFNTDYTQNNLQRLLQGIFFADMREKADTIPINGSSITLTAVDGTNDQFEAASGLTVFKIGHIVLASGMGLTANNGPWILDAVAAGAIDVTGNLIAEASPPATARVQAVGFQFAADDAVITYSGGTCTMTTTIADLTTLGLIPGERVFLGGDSSTLRFANNQGFARIKTIAAHAIVYDETEWTSVSETTTGSKTVQMFFGKVLKNESTTNLIKRRTYQVERQVGSDANGVMSEYLLGAVADSATINIPQADKITTDIAFVACDNEQRTGLTGIKSGTRVTALGESAFNTSSDVRRIKLQINSAINPNVTDLFAYVTDVKLSIKNNVKPTKAIGVLGAFDTTEGNFEVTGSLTAFFSNIPAVQAIRDNADVGLNMILARANAGFCFDIPLASLGNGRLNVTKDSPITLPLDANAAQNSFGYTLMANFFPYLPNLAMPV